MHIIPSCITLAPIACLLIGCSSTVPKQGAPEAPLQATPARGPTPQVLPATCPNFVAEYPTDALRKGETGIAVVEVHVDETGLQQGIRIVRSTGSETLDKATLRRFSGCKFQPAYAGDTPVSGKTTLEYTWELN